jgi:hypothetical protein
MRGTCDESNMAPNVLGLPTHVLHLEPGMNTIPRLVCWYSCGAASAVATKLAIAQYGLTHDIVIARCVVREEHPS